MTKMFENCINLNSVNFHHKYNLTNILDLSLMFENCISLTSLELQIYETNKLNNISYMFKNCSSLKYININYLDTTNVEDMSGLFYGCSSLTSINLTNFKTSNVLNFNFMFAGCLSLTSIDIEFFEINKVKNLDYLFSNCSGLNIVKLPNLNEMNLSTNKMFIGCTKLIPSNIIISNHIQIKPNDICIVGLWYGSNYGSMLTYYALHEIVKSMGYSVLMINDPLEPDNINFGRTHPKSMVSSFYRISQKKKLNELYEFNKECKCFLVGSDQLWNINLSRPLKQFYFLGFVDNKTKKLSYGTSFGTLYKGTSEEKKITKFNLERFDGISVRDELSLTISREIFGIENTVQVCDPSFLLDFSSYIKLLKKVHINISDEYFLAYILDPNPEIGFQLEQISIDKNCKIIILLDHLPIIREKNKKKFSLSGAGNIEIKDIYSIEEWLWYFYNSKSIFTDSYHGTIFSIIFKKPFITLKNKERGGERFISLLKPINLMDRLLESPNNINKIYDLYDKINYNATLQKLSKIKEYSYKWLENKLEIIFK